MNKWEKELNEAINRGVYSLAMGIKRLVVRIFRGLLKIRSLKLAGLFIVFVGFALLTYWQRNGILRFLISSFTMPSWTAWLLWGTVLGCPVWYLMILEGGTDRHQKKYEAAMREIGFRNRDGTYPRFVCRQKDPAEKRKIIYTFSSGIPIQDWIGAESRLETALDCNILRFASGKSKKVIRLITVPNEFQIPDYVGWNKEKLDKRKGVIVIGEGALEPESFDLDSTPHALIAGETGSGKSVILRNILCQLIYQGARIFMFDFKGGVEFGQRYQRYGEVVTTIERALELLKVLVAENEARLSLFQRTNTKKLAEYNQETGSNLPRIAVFIDELAEITDKTGVSKDIKETMQEIEGCLATLARRSRATCINLFLGVQRPDAKVVPGQIKNNVPVRICGRFADKPASEIVLGNSDAVFIPNIKGRFLLRIGNEIRSFQAYYFDDERDLPYDHPIVSGGMATEGAGDVVDKEHSIGDPQEGETAAISNPQKRVNMPPIYFDSADLVEEDVKEDPEPYDPAQDDGVIDWFADDD